MTLPDTKESILIVDDQPSLCETLKSFLRKKGYQVASCNSADEALNYLRQASVDLVLTDVCMPGMTGLELLREISESGGNQAVILMTAFASIDQSVTAMRYGASDYITKLFKLEELEATIEQALSRRRQNLIASSQSAAATQMNGNSHSETAIRNNGMPLVGTSRLMRNLFSMIERVAKSDSSVLIFGSTGTGKELVARQIHELSDRRNRPFIDINCSAIPETLIEAELFGHERGTFTGATETRPGLFEEASSGTLFLDEVDALHLSAQAKLLRVLQERLVRRVGGRKNIPVDVRIIAATNKNIRQAVANGSFRHDLMYRLCVVPIPVPQLRERGEDVPLLINFFLERHATRRGTARKSITEAAMGLLLNYSWPGNVRELENAIEYALVVSQGAVIDVDDIPDTIRSSGTYEFEPRVLQECMEANAPLAEVERRYVELMLERHNRHHINTAAALGIDRRTLSRKLQRYNSRGPRNGNTPSHNEFDLPF